MDNIRLSSTTPGTILVEWDVPDNVERSYHIAWTKTDEAFKPLDDLSGNSYPATSPYNITGLDAGVQYKIVMRAHCIDVYGEWSSEYTISVAP